LAAHRWRRGVPCGHEIRGRAYETDESCRRFGRRGAGRRGRRPVRASDRAL